MPGGQVVFRDGLYFTSRCGVDHGACAVPAPLSLPMEPSRIWGRIWVAAKRDPDWGIVRQGAWYPVLRSGATRLVLDVPGGPVDLPSYAVEISPKQPRRFTAVYRARNEPNPVQGTAADLGRVYAVCPMCASRVKLPPVPPLTLRCRKCRHEEIVAWWETG